MVAGTSPVRAVQEAADRCFSLISVSNSLSLSLSPSKKSIKYILKIKIKWEKWKWFLSLPPPHTQWLKMRGEGNYAVAMLSANITSPTTIRFTTIFKKYILLIFYKEEERGIES